MFFFFFVPSDEANETCDFLKGAKKRVSAYCNKYIFLRIKEVGRFSYLVYTPRSFGRDQIKVECYL